LNLLDLEPKKTILREGELQLNLLAGNLPAVLFRAVPDGSIVYVKQKGSSTPEEHLWICSRRVGSI